MALGALTKRVAGLERQRAAEQERRLAAMTDAELLATCEALDAALPEWARAVDWDSLTDAQLRALAGMPNDRAARAYLRQVANHAEG